MKMGYLLIVIGLVLAVTGGLLVCCKKSPQEESHQETGNARKQEVQQIPSEQRQELSAKQKGNDFEGYIADILKQNGIVIKSWNQGAVSPEGAMADNATDPDFFVAQNYQPSDLEYWVEAKWRNSCEESFSLKHEQYGRYREKQRESKRKIIVAVGIGGSPSQPASVYFVPLDSMPDGRISREDMRHFYLSNPGRDFKNRMERWFRNEVFNKKRN